MLGREVSALGGFRSVGGTSACDCVGGREYADDFEAEESEEDARGDSDIDEEDCSEVRRRPAGARAVLSF
jgi:hypothetical protein